MNAHTCDSCENGVSECPQCETVILGATGADWRDHFENDCTPLGTLYCFVE